MENYRIILDSKALEAFINWLPEPHPTEMYYLSLLARNKYCTGINHINSDRQQLKRVVTTKDRMFDKIMQMECPLGCYKQREISIPQEALALYIHPNPRSLKQAGITLTKRLVDLVTMDIYNGYNPQQEALSAIQGARGRKIFTDFDFDSLSYDIFCTNVLGKAINIEACTVVQTRSGLHVLVVPSRVHKFFEKNWYTDLRTFIPEEDKAIGDILLPVPGCTQGNFIPKVLILDGVMQ